ncbi:hypothetical protein HAZT_HAZT006119 [Hyalella azteca]|uniref:Ufm1-specific protease 1 n=1 Tax=Hyalella azteca TaxID=294128 RepID=A0A6A0H1B2_HYAAZ|nr:ufm1-specific protease 1 [Hyalella azteca]KAA0195533.1 hypothetical protein HAZT_HAZT006119 [Hyalella azteca]
MGGGQDYVCSLLTNPHAGLSLPPDAGTVNLVQGDYLFYHYGCDGFDDRGWGCGYRTLMSLSSWIRGQKLRSHDNSGFSTLAPVPANKNIQEILTKIQDKPPSFIGSHDWIGCVEAGYVLDELYGVECRIVHVASGAQLDKHVPELVEHFKVRGSPVMMGGDRDNLSKGIMGICQCKDMTYLLVVDPHFWGEARDRNSLQSEGYVQWKPLSEFDGNSFYNFCLPQLSAIASL